ncbi:hypothetical protein HOG16_04490 [Candidatus Woesearchaeota archaeon]|jgi:hypothetical protein|nr:hypothetical protein [Candidatus Woesearchaeota archaeon]MBT4417726.1 hypothetical protein [archaeon]
MIIELSFVLVGGVNLGLERQWKIVKGLLERYPRANWTRRINARKGTGKYIVKI